MKYKLLSALILTLLVSGCDQQSSQHAKRSEMPPTPVGYITVHSSNIPLTSELSGRTTATLTAQIRPQISGIILKRLFTEGQTVKEGDILYEIDPSTYQAAYEQAKSSVNKAQATLKAAQAKAQRYSTLIKTYSVSKQDYDDIQATYRESAASVAASQADLKTALINLERTKIRAPISGQIGISSVTPGSLVTANQTDALSTIRSIDEVYVDFTQSSVELLKLKKYWSKNKGTNNDQVTLILEDGTEYPLKGKLSTSEVSVDESTGSVTLRAIFNNPDHLLLPGMYVRVRISQAEVEGILAPQQGIINNPHGTANAFIIENNKAKKVEVTVSDSVENNWIITKGLKDNDQLIVEGTAKIQDGSSVQPQNLENKESK